MGSAHRTLTAMHSLFSLLALVGSGLAISIEDSGIVCKEEGFHPHPTTCAKFYRCVRWSGELELVLFQCAPGTIWLPGDTVCAHLEGDACQIGQTSKAPSTTEATTAATTPATTTQAPTTEATPTTTSTAAPLPLPGRGDLLSERTQVRSRVRESHVSTFRDPSSRQRAGEPARSSRSSEIVGSSHRAAVSMGIGSFLSSKEKGSNTLNLNITWQKIQA